MKRWNHIRDSIIQLVVGIVVISMIVWTGNEAASELIAPTVIAAFVLMTLSVTNALIPLSDAIDRIPSYVESAHRLNQVEGKDTLQYEEDLHGDKEYVASKHIDIELNHVSYSYPDSNEFVLKDVSLQIKSREENRHFRKKRNRKINFIKTVNRCAKPIPW